jgi:hypothetical protein
VPFVIKRFPALAGWLLALAIAPQALGAPSPEVITLPDIQSARAMGMGGAFRASGLGADAVLGNPAALTMIKAFQTDVHGAYDFPHKQGFGGVSLRDSQTSDFAAGVSYDFVGLGKGPTRSYGNLATLAVAMPIADILSIGLSGKYLNQWGYHLVNAATMDAGVIVKPGGGLTLGASGHNLIDTTQPELSRYFAGSVGFVIGGFNVLADIRSTLKKIGGQPLLNTGAEYTFGQSFSLRAGYTHDFLLITNYVAGGLGFSCQGGGIDVSYRQQLGGAIERLFGATIRLSM